MDIQRIIPSRQLTLWYFALAGALRSVCERGAFRPVADESANHRAHPHTDSIMALLKTTGAAILCVFCKECEGY